MNRVEGKVVIVTGGSLGIGRSACLLLAAEGAKVAVTDLRLNEGNKLVDEIKSKGGTAKFWQMDVSKEKEVSKVFAEIHKEWGKINVLVNNAGIAGANKPTHELTEEEWDQVFNVDVKGVFFCTKHAIPYLKEAGSGSIINLSSIYGLVGAADLSAYHAAKGAVRLMSKTDAMLYAENKIRVNSIHPGCIWTPLVETLAKQTSPDTNDFLAQMTSLHPLGHIGEPDDIGYAIVYLASDESKFVTGSELVIDGGYTAK